MRHRTPVLVLRHAKENWKSTNSARWAALAMERCELVTHGDPSGPLQLEGRLGVGSWLLFPGGTSAPPPAGAVTQLVVLDGTWRQARRLLQHSPVLRHLPRWSLPEEEAGGAPGPSLRRTPAPGRRATLQAIAAAFRVLEGEAPAAALEALYDGAVERVLRSKGRSR